MNGANGWAVAYDGTILANTVDLKRSWAIRRFCEEYHNGNRIAYDRERMAGRAVCVKVVVSEWAGW